MRPKRFEQQTLAAPSLNLKPRTLDLGSFPVIDDFKVILAPAGPLGRPVWFISDAKGILATFPWWDDAEIDVKKMSPDKIPSGSLDEPFTDMEQSWTIYIFESGDHVCVLEGGDISEEGFENWFKVPKEDYLGAWRRLIEETRQNAALAGTFESALAAPELVRKLVIKDRGISKIPHEIGRLTGLEELDLSMNEIAAVPEDLGNLQSLRKLKLGFNRIKSLPNGVFQLSQLEVLEVDHNRIGAIPPLIEKLWRLNFLVLVSNRLTALPEEVFRLPHLLELLASDNAIKKLPELLFAPPCIRHISLGANRLDEQECSRLRSLFVDSPDVHLELDF